MIDINSFFKKKNKTASIITAHGPSQWHGPGCQRSVKGASVPRGYPPPYLLSPAHARALVSPGCSDDFSPSAALTEFAGCRLMQNNSLLVPGLRCLLSRLQGRKRVFVAPFQ